MPYQTTIDGAGRLVIPKPLRDRFGLTAGTRLNITAEEGELRISPDRAEPALVERNGFLVIDLSRTGPIRADHREERERRIRRLLEYATEG